MPDIVLKLEKDFREKVEKSITAGTLEIVKTYAERNEKFRTLTDLLLADRLSVPTTAPFKGASDLVDPLIKENQIALKAMLMQAMGRHDLVMASAIDPGMDESASRVEMAFNVRIQQDGFRNHAYDICDYATALPFAITRVDWKQRTQTQRQVMLKGPDGVLVQEGQQDPNLPYEEVKTAQDIVTDEGFKFRAVNPADWYLEGGDENDIDTAERVRERIWFTREDLIRSPDKIGTDRKVIDQLIKMGPTHDAHGSEIYEDYHSREGATPVGQAWYECFMVTGRMPMIIEDGKNITPEDYWEDDFVWIVCPKHDLCLLFKHSDDAMRPYIRWNMLPRPNREQGECVPEMLETFQTETTSIRRWGIDSANLSMSPVLLVQEDYWQDYNKYQIYPGAILPYRTGSQVPVPLQMNTQAGSFSLELAAALYDRAKNVVSAESYGSYNQQDRTTATAVNAAMAPVSTKFDLFLNNITSSVPRFSQVCLSVWAKNMSPDGETLNAGTQPVQVTPDDLKQRFRFVASVSSDEANPQLQSQKAVMWAQFVMQLPQTQAAIQAGDFRIPWHLANNVGRAMRIRDKDAVLGPEPPTPEGMQMVAGAMLQGAQMIAQGAMQGQPVPQNPQQVLQIPAVAHAIVQAIQQAGQMQAQSADQGYPVLPPMPMPAPQAQIAMNGAG